MYAFLCFFVTFVVFIVIKMITQCWLLYPYFWLFYLLCLFCSRIGDYITEFDATVIQVRGLASYKTRFNPPFSTFENACTKSGIWQFLSIRFWCVLLFDFAMWLWTFRIYFPLSSVFLWFYFLSFENSLRQNWNKPASKKAVDIKISWTIWKTKTYVNKWRKTVSKLFHFSTGVQILIW